MNHNTHTPPSRNLRLGNLGPHTSKKRTKHIIFFLGSLPIIDAIMGLNDDLLLQKIGGISFFQIYRISLLLILGKAIITRFRFLHKRTKPVILFIKLFLCALITFSLKEIIETGNLSMVSIVAYIRITFWLMLWITCLIYCQSEKDCTPILKGIVIAGTIMTAAVFFSYLTGQHAIYSEDFSNAATQMQATSGGYRSGKSISGPLIIAAVVVLYLGRSKRSLLSAITAVCFSAAAFLTYNRTGLVSLILSVSWLLAAEIKRIPNVGKKNKVIFQFLIVACSLSFIYFSATGLGGLLSRWGDINPGNNIMAAGSGRAGLWLSAIDWFQRTDLTNQLFGVGYNGMFKVNYFYFNNPMIHSHSDLFDLLLIGGVSGVSIWILFFLTFFRQAKQLSTKQPEFPFVIAIFFVTFSYSLLTSAFYGPNMMGIVILSTVAVSNMAKQTP